MNELEKGNKKIRNCFWKQSLICAILLLVITVFYVMIGEHIAKKKDKEHLCADNFNYVFQIDEVRKEGQELVLDGWAFELGKDMSEGDIEVWLYDIEERKIVYPRHVKYGMRSDVNDYFANEYDYSSCGIVVRFNEKKLHTLNKYYEVLISDKVNSRVIRTETYLWNGTMMCCLPEDYIELPLEGTALEDVVKNGIMRVCRSDVGMYIFQYEDYLYWIVDETCEFVNKENTYIDLMIQTTQPHLLPEIRKVDGHIEDNLDYIFQDKEFVAINGYRAAKVKIPKEYSITSILTGHRANGEWAWSDKFRIYYVLEKENTRSE